MAALVEGLEPQAEKWWWLASAPAPETSAAVLSIAISIKRIADTLESLQPVSIQTSLDRIANEVAGVPYDHAPGADNARHRMGITDGIMHAIEQGLLAASQRG